MKVLIEIDERMYKALNSYPCVYSDYVDEMFNIIRNGTPLNGTNGEVFGKIMGYMSMDDAYITTDRRGYLHLRGVKDDWWNADYKGGGVRKTPQAHRQRL
jgi:hypothetical protein